MHLNCVVILFILSITGCRCGLLNWFSGLADELDSENAKTKCRERRETEENRIKPDITKSAADKMVSLMDIEKGKLTAKSELEPRIQPHHGNPKAKRCPRGRYRVSAINPVVGAAKQNPNVLPLVKRDSTAQERCNACTNRAACKLLGKCAQCNEDCKNIAIYTNDFLTPWTNQTVGMAHRMTSPSKNDIFSKTLYPVATFREGETMNIICRIVGITDTSDIERVTILVSTFSNTPPKSLNGMTLEKSDTSEKIKNAQNMVSPSLNSMPMVNGKTAQPQMQGRFNDYDDEDNSVFSRGRNNDPDKIKHNPDLIEGPPPFVSSNNLNSPIDFSTNSENNNLQDTGISGGKTGVFDKPVIVQPKEFASDESDEDDDDDDDEDVVMPSSLAPSAPPLIQESTTTKNVIKPTLLSRLRELASSRTNTLLDIKDQLQKAETMLPSKGGFLKNLLKPRNDVIEDPKNIISAPAVPKSFSDPMKNMERFAANENKATSIKLPGESDDQISKINEAIQEVKSMVKNIQEETSKTSEKRLLGASHNLESMDFLHNNNNNNAETSIPNNQISQVLPDHVADNFKKVNQYFINRAQDALDMIGPQAKKDEPLKPAEENALGDDHSELTKNTITNFKKMPQFLLERFRDTLNGFENNPESNPAIGLGTNDIIGAANGNIELNEKFGGDKANDIDLEENIASPNIKVDPTGVSPNINPNESVVELPEQNILENSPNQNKDTNSSITTTTTTYKKKLEKYLQELKEKRQKTYSPEKYLKSAAKKSSKMTSLPMEGEVIESPRPSTIQNLINAQKDLENIDEGGKATPNILMSTNDLEKQREVLREKLRKFIDGVKTKTGSIPLPIKFDDTPSSPASTEPGQNTRLTVDNKNVPDLSQSPATKELNDQSLSQNFPENIPSESADQVVGESNYKNDEEGNDVDSFIPAVPKLPKNGFSSSSRENVIESTKSFNKFQKYLDDIKAKQSSLLKPKVTSDINLIQNKDPTSENQLQDKKDLLKTKVKNYIDNLKKPVDETVGQPEMSFNQRMSDEVSSLNNKVKTEMKNVFGSTPDIFKKDLLKEKLKNYVDSLKKPMGSKLVPDLLRKSSDAQRQELNSLKNKLESLLQVKESTPSLNLAETPVNSKAIPNIPVRNSLFDKDLFPVISPAKTGLPNNLIVGDVQHSAIDGQFEQVNDESSLDEQIIANQDGNLPSSGSIGEGITDISDWSHSLGKIVQGSSKSSEMFFLGSGVKLPLKVTQGPNGSMDLSVDLEKLCSCYNATCSKNQTAIEETVGAILEKEAELNEQLKGDSLDDVKIEPVVGSRQAAIPVADAANLNKRPTIFQKLRDNINLKSDHKRKSNIFKRSSDIKLRPELTTIKNVLEKLKMDNENKIKNNMYNLPTLPTFETVANELTNLGNNAQNYFSNAVLELGSDVEGLKKELEDKFVNTNQNWNSILGQNVPTIPTFGGDLIQDSLNEMKAKADEINYNILGQLNTENLKNKIDLPKLSNLDTIPDEITNLGKKAKNYISNSVHELENNLAGLKEELEDKFVNANQNWNSVLSENLPLIPTHGSDWIQDSLNEMKEKSDDINNDILKKLNIANEETLESYINNVPKLSNLDTVSNELTNLGKKVKDSFTNSVQELENNVDGLRNKLEEKLMKANQNSNSRLGQNFPTIPSYSSDSLQNSLNEIKENADYINNNFLERLEHENNLNKLLNVNGIQKNSKAGLLFKSLKPTDSPLKPFKYDASSRSNVIRKNGSKKLQTPKKQARSTTKDPFTLVNEFKEKLKKSLPVIPELQNRIEEINDEVVKITDSYQFGKANVLEKKLNQLDNEVKKYYKNNEKLLAEESKKMFGGHNNEIIAKEVNIINKIISWVKSLASGINTG